MFVIDASVVLAWCFEDEASDDAGRVLERLEHEPAVAPANWPLEVANALRTAERLGQVDASELPRLRSLLAALPVEIAAIDLGIATGAVLDTALRFELTANEAAYLELAAVRGIPLATVDASLRTACARAGVERVA